MKYHIWTLGCQMNKSDSERIAAVLEKAGWRACADGSRADLIVVNACSVRQTAVDRIFGKSRQWQKKRKHRRLKTVLTGCVLGPDKKKFADKFDFILAIQDIEKLPTLVRQQRDNAKMKQWPREKSSYLEIKPLFKSKFSAFAPIMTGCNNFCAYCVVPYVRSREISRSAKEILAEAGDLVKRDCKEIILLGQNVNSYKGQLEKELALRGVPSGIGENEAISKSFKGDCFVHKGVRDNFKSINFPRLLKMVNDVPGDFWLRFTTSHPKDMSDELIKAMSECDKLCEYIHLPIQAGDDQVLKRMNRGYTVARYKKLANKLRKAIPGIAIGTDVIVGFPGETKKQFQNTVKLFREVKFDMAYIAQYSVRAGTAAAKLVDNVSREEKKRREKVLTKVLAKTILASNKKLVGETVDVLVDRIMGGVCLGKTRTNKTVKFKAHGRNLIGRIVPAEITGAMEWGLQGNFEK